MAKLTDLLPTHFSPHSLAPAACRHSQVLPPVTWSTAVAFWLVPSLASYPNPCSTVQPEQALKTQPNQVMSLLQTIQSLLNVVTIKICCLKLRYSKCGPWTSCIGLTWRHVRDAESQDPSDLLNLNLCFNKIPTWSVGVPLFERHIIWPLSAFMTSVSYPSLCPLRTTFTEHKPPSVSRIMSNTLPPLPFALADFFS